MASAITAPLASYTPPHSRIAAGSISATPYMTSATYGGAAYHQTSMAAGGYQTSASGLGYQSRSGMTSQMSSGVLTTPGYPAGVTSMELPAQERERRHVSSTVIGEELLGTAPEESIRYVEVPYVEEVVRHVPRKEVVEVEKRVPKYEVEWVERIVDVPQVQIVDKTVEVPQVQEVVRHIPRKEIVDVPKEYVRHVPKVETKIVEKMVEIPGEVIEIPKPYTVEQKVPVAHYQDVEVPFVVAQSVRPVLTEGHETVDVEVLEYEPEVIPVDIHVPKVVPSQLISVGMVEEHHRIVQVPAAQYNSMVKLLNPHISDSDGRVCLPYVLENGSTPMLSDKIQHVQPKAGIHIEGYHPGQYRSHGFTSFTTGQVQHQYQHGSQQLTGQVMMGGMHGGMHPMMGHRHVSSHQLSGATYSHPMVHRHATSSSSSSSSKVKKTKGKSRRCPC